jgi:hypothetical protein
MGKDNAVSGEWQPIETAPRGELLLYFPPLAPPRGREHDAPMPAMYRVDFNPVTYPRKPTHWMPLKPPATP